MSRSPEDDRQRWPLVKALFAKAMEQPASQRSSFLLASSVDSGLVHEVHRLLQLQGEAGAFLSVPVAPTDVEMPPIAAGTLSVGTVLAGRYRIDRCIGSGGMGGVYAAYDLILQVDVALKTITDAREVVSSRAVTHPNVCRIFDYGIEGTTQFLTMELLRGRTLAEHIACAGPLDEEEIQNIGSQICSGLSAAHEAAVIHRDLKPANIFLTESGRVVITDFGLARFFADPNLRTSSQIIGTLAYMAPEVLAGHPATTRSDIYSLGVVLHEAATGKLPVEGSSSLAGPLRKLIHCCLQMDPHLRPAKVDSIISPRTSSLLRGILRFCYQRNSYGFSMNAKPASNRLGRNSIANFTR